MDLDQRCVELPEDFPPFPNRAELIQELSEVLLSFGVPPGPDGAPPPPRPRAGPGSPGSAPPTPGRERRSATLRRLEDDGRNGNLGGEELAVLELLQGSATLERLQALTRRTGVTVARVDALRAGALDGPAAAPPPPGHGEEELRCAKLSVQLREVFAARFTAMFCDYEAFVIQSAPDLEAWLTNREQMHNFDKVGRPPPWVLVPSSGGAPCWRPLLVLEAAGSEAQHRPVRRDVDTMRTRQ